MPLCIKQLSTFKSKNRKFVGFLFIDLVLKPEIFQPNGTTSTGASAQINGGGGKAPMTNGAANGGGNTQV